MLNFRDETSKAIAKFTQAGFAIDEALIKRCDLSPKNQPCYTQRGGEDLCWDELAKALNLDDFEYDEDFGEQYFGGWITFKDTSDFLKRGEYDGSEWWEIVKRPCLNADAQKNE